jgi:signal transduction histidine kinase/CheY-like chemotaxis protein
MSRVLAFPLEQPAIDSGPSAVRPHVGVPQRCILWLSSWAGAIRLDRPIAWRYAAALAALVVATAARQLLDGYLETRAPYGVYLIAVLFVAWRAGWGPSLVTLVAGAALGRFLFDAPRYSFSLATDFSQTGLIMSLTIGLAAIYFCESLRLKARMNRRLYDAARQADARKDEFLATVAHELRNPLMPIRTAIYLLAQDPQQSPRTGELQQMLSRHTEHLIRLVNDLLDVSRITQGKIELRLERVHLLRVVDSAIEAVRPLIDEKRQELRVNLPEGTIVLEADGVRLTQVFTNLLHNAAKYTGKEGRIWLSADVADSQLVLRIRDTGVGIPPEMCERVFDLFQQVQRGIESTQGGLGIGLTLVRELVLMHRGTVSAASPGVGLGSEFTVRLPVVVAEPRAARAVTNPQHIPQAPAGPARRVLVVDDSPGIRKSLEMILKDWAHIVRTCPDGFAALEEARLFKPDIILADLSMPRMSGYKLAQELRRLPEAKQAVLIAISGFGQQADVQLAQQSGFDCHLTKPVDLTELQSLLAKPPAPPAQAHG